MKKNIYKKNSARYSIHLFRLLYLNIIVLFAILSWTTLNAQPLAQWERPGACNTGPYDESILIPSGTITITEDNTVLENLDITGIIKVYANNLTVRNFRINAQGALWGIRFYDDYSGLTIEDGEIYDLGESAVKPVSNYTARRINVHDSDRDGFKVGYDVLIESCWIHHLGRDPEAHADAVQGMYADNVTIRGCFMEGPYPLPSGYKFNAAAIIQTDFGPVSNVTIENNWVDGGNYCIQLRDKDNGFGCPTNSAVLNNHFSGNMQYGYLATGGCSVTTSGNLVDPDGTSTIPPCSNSYEPTAVTGVTVSPTTLNIDVGTIGMVTKSILPSNATNKSVTWSSSNTSVATIDAFGYVTGISIGTCSVTATTVDGGFTASCSVEVDPAGTNPSNVSINKPVTVSAYQDDVNGTFPGSNLVDGNVSDAARWSAEGFPQWAVIDLENVYDLSIIELTTYQSRDYQYIVEASMDGSNYTTIVDRSANTQGSGLVDAVSAIARYVKITVSGANSYGGTWSSLNELEVIGILSGVMPEPVTGVSVSPTTLNLEVAQTSDLTETVSPSNATNKTVVWSSTNTSVATVNSSGLVTAVGVGNATITVTTNDGGFTDNCAVTVTSVPVTGVSVSPTSLSIAQGLTSDLTETVSPANATDKTVVWSSDNTSIATVNSSGLVTAISEGAATITVTTNDGSYTATCDVTVTYTPHPVGGYYCDPVSGNISNDGSQASPWPSLQAVIAAGKTFDDGETIYLMNGNHGALTITEDNTADVTITRAPEHNPVIQRIAFVGASHWVLDNVDVSSGGIQVPTNPPLEHPVYPILQNTLVEISGSCSYITLDNCYIYSIDNSSSWTADDWNYKAWSGISHKEADHVTIRNCHVKNVNFGLDNNNTISNTLYEYNTIENYNGDGIRGHGVNTVIQYNTIKNSYTTNGNHGDMMQVIGTTHGLVVRGNKFLIRTDPNQPFQGACQGLGLFDGMYYDFVIENNLVVCDHWNGITLLGAVNCKVVNNTLIDINNVDPGPAYIKVAAHKDGTPSTGNLVRNNLCTDLSNDAGIGVVDNNIEISWSQYDTYFNDFANCDYSLKAGCNAIDAGSSSQAPTIDIDGNARDANVDIGCYEYDGVPPVPVDATGVSVAPASLSIDVGQSSGLTETISPYNATDKTVTWSSSNTSIAIVDANGLVSGVSEGSCTVTVTTNDGGFTANCAVTINPEGTTPTNVALNKPITVSAYQDDTYGTYPGSNLVDGDVSDATRWSAETFPQWAEIDLQDDYDLSSIELYTYQSRDYQYIVEAKPDGGSYTTIVDRSSNTQGSGLTDAVSITARYVKITVSGANSYAGTWSSLNELIVMGVPAGVVNVNNQPTIDPISNVLVPDDAGEQTVNLTGISDGDNNTQTIVVSAISSDEVVANNVSVNYTSGNTTGTLNFTPVVAGTATITVTVVDDGGTANGGIDTKEVIFVVTVEPACGGITSVTLNCPPSPIEISETYQFTETVLPVCVSDKSVTWSSSNTSVATIDGNGLVTGVGAGTATITVTTNNGGLTANCNITVNIAPDPLSPNIVGYWSLDEVIASVTPDDSGNGNDGTVSGAAITAGKISNALNFDGVNDNVSLGNIDVLPSSENDGITLAAWVNPDSWYESNYDNRIISKATGTSEQDHYWMLSGIKSGDISVLRFRLKTGSTTSTLIASAAGEIGLNQWTHVAATYDGANMKVYVNGNLVGNIAKTGTIATNIDVEATIGINPDGARPFDGQIDEVYVLNRGLNETEINDLMIRQQSGTVNPTSVTLNPTLISLEEGLTAQLIETVLPANATDQSVSWSSSNTSVAIIDANGLVTAINAGVATITVTTNDGGFTANCEVIVTIPVISVAGVTITPASIILDKDQTLALTETVSPIDATDKSVTWASSNTNVATVDAYGMVTTVSAGNTTIIVTTNDGGFIANCDVTVNIPPLPEWVTLTYDDFEAGFGNYTSGGGDCYLDTQGTNAHQGSNAVAIVDDDEDGSSFWHTNAIDVTSFADIKIEFWYKAYSMEVGESFEIQYFDGNSWVTLASRVSGTDFSNNAFYCDEVTLSSPNQLFTNQFKVRFECIASSSGDYIYIDEIKVSAIDDPYKSGLLKVSGIDDPYKSGLLSNPDILSDNTSVRIYPNPVSGGYFNVGLEGFNSQYELSFKIFDMTGRLVYLSYEIVGNNNDVKQIQLNSDVNKGLYMLHINNNKKSIQKKLIIK